MQEIVARENDPKKKKKIIEHTALEGSKVSIQS